MNNLRYADDTTLMAEREEELKSFQMKVKEDQVFLNILNGLCSIGNKTLPDDPRSKFDYY